MASNAPTSDVVELVQQLIRNECVNDGTAASGEEVRNVDLIDAYLAGVGLDTERFDAVPGRSNLVARIEGTDPGAPTLCLLGHTDVVPVNEHRWTHDPFGGEIIDGCVWGRGAIDMFNLTASMAVAMKAFAASGLRPRGTLIYAAVADEEAGGELGARFLAEREPEAVACDYLVTESGGFPLPSPAGVRLPYLHEEKGPLWASLKVHGAPCHGSMPFRADNALLKAAEVVRRLGDYRPPSRLDDSWRAFVGGLGLPSELADPLLREEGFVETLEMLPLGLSKLAYSCTHTTITPTVLAAGSKVNIIPDEVDISLDVRVLPGDDAERVREMIAEALGDLAGEVAVTFARPDDLATSSPATGPFVDALHRASQTFYPGAELVPMRMVGTTDARHFRRTFGTAAYGFGMWSTRLGMDQLATMGHGDDERIDIESLDLSVALWDVLVRDFLG
ncbi:MAG TPA: M20/M25/M40 family metallo-hydrolase [Acidimicrobiales bacterium]|nr:M20/M25/M40 family metallo-hydrolase [Acidimicrobiales bacterium]